MSSVYRASNRKAEQETEPAPNQANLPTDIARPDDGIPVNDIPAVAPKAVGPACHPVCLRRGLTPAILAGLTALASTGTIRLCLQVAFTDLEAIESNRASF